MAAVITALSVRRTAVRDVYGCGRCHGSGMETRFDRGGLSLRECDCPQSRDAARQNRAKAAALAEADGSAAPDLAVLARVREALIAQVGAGCYARWAIRRGRS